ncbi:ABC transporter permease subunit ['Chrysanthemum coronarium' phytoplasma]|uniref:ABC-type dipeptide/oligopeptide/nickel transport systems, permease components n=1 Tax='Chrysanthemum coronarium' phytoplasma TaxID=1520703 RepID=A0ABQ0J1W4_9MOLU|nr:ABC transporter permease subunit ['Chrysanthemum coronarium' phytoplasma]GAK73610.1 ABC-type dipeptide/oligopeptide/nickel transport systems, permease components ['Chrysanthemum coronarium' phytoplasma]
MKEFFSIDGAGRLMIEAFQTQDQPLLMFCFGFCTFISLITNILGDLSYRLLDPRIKIGSKKDESV